MLSLPYVTESERACARPRRSPRKAIVVAAHQFSPSGAPVVPLVGSPVPSPIRFCVRPFLRSFFVGSYGYHTFPKYISYHTTPHIDGAVFKGIDARQLNILGRDQPLEGNMGWGASQPTMTSCSYVDELEEQRRELEARRATLEERFKLRLATAQVFESRRARVQPSLVQAYLRGAGVLPLFNGPKHVATGDVTFEFIILPDFVTTALKSSYRRSAPGCMDEQCTRCARESQLSILYLLLGVNTTRSSV